MPTYGLHGQYQELQRCCRGSGQLSGWTAERGDSHRGRGHTSARRVRLVRDVFLLHAFQLGGVGTKARGQRKEGAGHGGCMCALGREKGAPIPLEQLACQDVQFAELGIGVNANDGITIAI